MGKPIDKALGLCEEYINRAEYQEKTGKIAPPADPSRPAQYFDAVGDFSRYTGPTVNGETPVELVHAQGLNLPGVFKRPKFVPDKSGKTTLTVPGVGVVPYDPMLHSSRAEAEQLHAEMVKDLGDTPRTALTEWDPREGGPGTLSFTNDRRLFKIGDAFVGFLLIVRHNGGVGAPGHWTDNGSYAFVRDKEPTATGAGVTLMPHRDLNNEHVSASMFGLLVEPGPGLAGDTPAPATGDLGLVLAKLDLVKRQIDHIQEILEAR